MAKTLHAIFDGKAFRTIRPIKLKPNTHCIITIEPKKISNKRDAWDVLGEFTGKIEGPSDWAKEHDHYLYGKLKKK